MVEKNSEEILAILGDSSLATLIQNIKLEKFDPSRNNERVGENETVIGELNVYEKALCATIDDLLEEACVIAKAKKNILEEGEKKGKEVNLDEVRKNETDRIINDDLCNAYNLLLWVSVKKRLGAPAVEGFGLRIREGYKIVSHKENIEPGGWR